MPATVVNSGSIAGNTVYNAALFSVSQRENTFTNMAIDGAPKQIDKNKIDPRKQTSAGAPIVRITDISKNAGDEVYVDLFHTLKGLPTMGDRKLAGRLEGVTSSQFSLKVNQGRHGVDAGSVMSQKRTKHNLKNIAKSMLGPWWNQVDDETTMIHMAGARGTDTSGNWILPTEDHEEFSEFLVNEILPPTYDRHFFGGDATSVDSLDSADLFSLSAIQNLRAELDVMADPLQPVKFEGDKGKSTDPFHVFFASPRQWNDIWDGPDGDKLRQLQADAIKRGSMFSHPVFSGDCFMWRGILVRKMTRSIRFATGSGVPVSTNTNKGTTTTANANTNIERGILLGAQALAVAWGNTSKGFFNIHEEKSDHGNSTEMSLAWINGKKKFQFEDKNGRINDHGVIVLDTAVSK